MGEVVTIGLDIAKSVFQVHGVDCRWRRCLAPAGSSGALITVLCKAARMFDWHRGVRKRPLLGAGTQQIGPPSATNAAELREAIR